MSCICLACSYFEMSLGAHKIVDQPDVIILTLGDTILALCVAICRSETVCILAFYMLSREWRWRTQGAMPCRGLFTLWHCIFINLFWFPVNIKLRSKDSRIMYVTSSCFLWTGFHNFNLTSPEAEFRFGKIDKFASFWYFAHTATWNSLKLHLTLTWSSPVVHLTFTWPSDHHLTSPWPLPNLN